MWRKRYRPRAGPSALHRHILEIVFDQLANPRRAIDMRKDLQEEAGRGERRFDRGEIRRFMLIAHGRRHDPYGAVIERSHQHVDLWLEAWARKLFGKAPELASAGDRALVVQE